MITGAIKYLKYWFNQKIDLNQSQSVTGADDHSALPRTPQSMRLQLSLNAALAVTFGLLALSSGGQGSLSITSAPSAEADAGSAQESASKQRLRAMPDCNEIGHGSMYAGIRQSVSEVAANLLLSAVTVNEIQAAVSQVWIERMHQLTQSGTPTHHTDHEAKLPVSHKLASEVRRSSSASVRLEAA